MISLLWMLVFGVKWLRTSCRTLWLFWWAELFNIDVPSIRPGLGSREAPAQLTSRLNPFVCLPQWAKNILFYHGMCHKGKVVGKHCWRGPGAPPWWSHSSWTSPIPCLRFLHQPRAWRGPSPGPGSDACWMNHGSGRPWAREGSVWTAPSAGHCVKGRPGGRFEGEK